MLGIKKSLAFHCITPKNQSIIFPQFNLLGLTGFYLPYLVRGGMAMS